MKERTIVKMQMPCTPDGQALVYNKYRNVFCFEHLTEEIKALMGGEAQRFFYAKVVIPLEGRPQINIEEQAPWQDW